MRASGRRSAGSDCLLSDLTAVFPCAWHQSRRTALKNSFRSFLGNSESPPENWICCGYLTPCCPCWCEYIPLSVIFNRNSLKVTADPCFYMRNLCCNSIRSITRAGTHQGKQTRDFPQLTFFLIPCEQSFKLQSAHTATQHVDFCTKENPLWNVNSMKKTTSMSTTWGASWANEIPAVYHVTSCTKLLLCVDTGITHQACAACRLGNIQKSFLFLW